MSYLPTHKAVQQSDSGLFLKEVSPSVPGEPVAYAHRDDYYIFGLGCSGSCCVSIDFRDFRLSQGEMICTQPGQIHRVVDAGDIQAFLLFVDSVFIAPADKQIIAEYALSPAPFRMADAQLSELKQLFRIILRRINDPGDDDSKRIVQHLSCAAIGMITQVMRNTIRRQPKKRRYVEITLAFKELLAGEQPFERTPSHYAEKLHLSPVYLNEAVRNVTGESVGRYIQKELVLRAKRMLVYTSQNIREIAFDLGFEDHAYFTRLFTKVTGLSPSSFRKKYRG